MNRKFLSWKICKEGVFFAELFIDKEVQKWKRKENHEFLCTQWMTSFY